MKVNTSSSYKEAGSGSDSPIETKEFLKNKRNGGFSFKVRFLNLFLYGSLNPPNYELAPQIPENNYMSSSAS